jgi:hypothetical protein
MQYRLKERQEISLCSVMAVYELSKNTDDKYNVTELFVNNFFGKNQLRFISDGFPDQ